MDTLLTEIMVWKLRESIQSEETQLLLLGYHDTTEPAFLSVPDEFSALIAFPVSSVLPLVPSVVSLAFGSQADATGGRGA